MDILQETTAPLAWDEEQMPFQLPKQAIAWKIRRFTGRPGRPRGVYGEHGIIHLGLEATVADLRRVVDDEPGSYRLYPVDAAGNELEPIGCMELKAPKRERAEAQVVDPSDSTMVAREVVKLCTQMVASRDQHDELISKVLTTLVTTTATIQRSTAALLGVANTTIQVANGVEALERVEPEPLDTAALAEQLATAITPAKPSADKPQQPWFVEILKGPVGMGIMQFVSNFAVSMQRQVEAQQAQPQAPAPQPPPPQPPQPDAHETDDDPDEI